jgi:energy-converting hydrogenase Eha subunit B
MGFIFLKPEEGSAVIGLVWLGNMVPRDPGYAMQAKTKRGMVSLETIKRVGSGDR